MSREALAKVIQRSISDGAFRRQLSTDPTGALRGYDLSSDEFAAIKSGDANRLTTLGVEQRMSKAFTLATDASASSASVSSDLGASYSGALATGAGATTSGAFADPGSAAAAGSVMDPATGGALTQAEIDPGTGGTGQGALITGDGADADPLIVDVGGASHGAAITGGDTSDTLGADTDPDGPQWFHVLTPPEGNATDVLVTDDAGAGGASGLAEASDGPNITP